MPYQDISIQTKLYPSFAEALDLMKKFINDDDKARDARGFMSVLNRIAVSSPRISGHILTRNVALAGYDWSLVSADKNVTERLPEIKQRLELIISEFLNNHAQTSLFGASAYQLSWGLINNIQTPKIVYEYLPQELDILSDGKLAILDDKNTKTPIDIYDINYFFDKLPPSQRGGKLRSIIFHELLRNETVKEWSNLNKRMKGIVLGLIKAQELQKSAAVLNMSETQVQNLLSNLDATLQGAGENNYMKTIDAIDIKMASLVDGAAGNSFATLKNVLDSDIAIAILGQANTSELPQNGGSRAAVQVLNLIRSDILYADMITAKNRINRFLQLDYRVNNGEGAVCPYYFKFLDLEQKDFEQNARIYEIVQRIGLPVVKSEFYSNLNLTAPSDDNDILELKQNNNINTGF